MSAFHHRALHAHCISFLSLLDITHCYVVSKQWSEASAETLRLAEALVVNRADQLLFLSKHCRRLSRLRLTDSATVRQAHASAFLSLLENNAATLRELRFRYAFLSPDSRLDDLLLSVLYRCSRLTALSGELWLSAEQTRRLLQACPQLEELNVACTPFEALLEPECAFPPLRALRSFEHLPLEEAPALVAAYPNLTSLVLCLEKETSRAQLASLCWTLSRRLPALTRLEVLRDGLPGEDEPTVATEEDMAAAAPADACGATLPCFPALESLQTRMVWFAMEAPSLKHLDSASLEWELHLPTSVLASMFPRLDSMTCHGA